MSNEENKRYVITGLKLRKIESQNAEREARLEQYEQDQFHGISENCAGARMKREEQERTRQTVQQDAARRQAEARARAERQRKEDAAMSAVRYYALACMVILWLAAWTHLPLWAGAALAMGLAVILAAYVFRIFFPIQEGIRCRSTK